MDFRVETTASAEVELADAVAYIATRSEAMAEKWLHGFYRAADSLARFPERCSEAPESMVLDFEVRQYLYGDYRVLFTIAGGTVYILHIRHGARQFLTAEQIDRPKPRA